MQKQLKNQLQKQSQKQLQKQLKKQFQTKQLLSQLQRQLKNPKKTWDAKRSATNKQKAPKANTTPNKPVRMKPPPPHPQTVATATH